MSTSAASPQITRRYQVLNQLGSGGMGVVYRVLDRLSGQVVALKQVTVDSDQLLFASRSDQRQDVRLALAHEFKLLASLRHPNIVSVLDYGFDSQRQPFFTMTLLEGALTILEAARKQPSEVQYGLLLQLLQAILYLHRRGILHRDLKPGNVLVINGQVKVLDFGLAVAREQASRQEDSISGTLAYLAPELLTGSPASKASDLYAVGVMAYELFAGRHPFRIENASLLLQDIIQVRPDVSALNLDSRMADILERLLAKNPQDRFEDAADIIAVFAKAAGQQTQYETAAIRESLLQAAQFVGREAELRQLSQALADTVKGRGGLWLVGGESGIGKSRLLDELRTLALVEGALVLRGQAVSEGGTPYSVWRDTLRQLCLQTELNDLEKSVLKPLAPDIGPLLGGTVADAPELDPQATHDRLVTVIGDVFARQPQPTVLVLEDVQWAGSESVALLKRLSLQVEERSLLLLASYRSDERPDLPKELPDAHRLSLERLSKERIADLSGSILGETTGRQAALVELLTDETEGNVFFIVEVLRALAEETGQLDRIGATTLPAHVFSGGMKTVVQRRLQRVPDWAQPLLQAAAVAGRQINPAVLRLVEPQTDLDSWLSLCADVSVLEFQDNQWRFGHDKLREGVLVDLPPERRQDLHQQVALAIEQCYPDDPTQAGVLAGHWGGVGNVVKEAHYAGLAGEQAAAKFVNREAIRFLERADALAEQAGAPLERRIRYLYLLGTAYYDGLGNLSEAVRQLERALMLAGVVKPKGQTQTAVKILGSLARQFWHRLMLDGLKRPQRLGPQSEFFEVSAEACGHLSQMKYLVNDKPALLYYALAFLNLAEQAGPAYLYLQARAYLVMVGGLAGIPLHGLARYYQRLAEAAAQASNLPDVELWTEEILGMYTAGRGQWSAALQRFSACSQLANQLGNARRWLEAQVFLSVMMIFQGKWDESAALNREIYAVSQLHGAVDMQNIAQAFTAIIALYQGRLEPAAEALRQSYETLKQTYDLESYYGTVTGWLAHCCARQGLFEEAEDYLKLFLAMPGLDAPVAFHLAPAYSGAAEAALTLWEAAPSAERRATARRALRALRRLGRIYDCGQPFVLLYDSWLAWLEGKPGRAVKFAEQAVSSAQQFEMPYAEGLAHYHLGRHLPTGDNRRIEHLRQAEALFERLGAAYDLEQARQALAGPVETASLP